MIRIPREAVAIAAASFCTFLTPAGCHDKFRKFTECGKIRYNGTTYMENYG